MPPKARTSLTSLERLERQLLAITPDRAQGDAWEKALKGWINAGGHPELTKAWMWGEWPGKLKAGLKGDKGVDLVAETRDKQLVAIQVKFRRDPNDAVTAPEVQKLVGSYRKHFTLFALASNAWSATRGVSEAVGDEDAMLILREQLLESSYDWAAKKSIKRTKFTPFPFQKLAAENARKALAKGGRAQIVMACGTGKTVTMLLAAEALDAQRVLVLAPTLLLVKQLRDEWISKRRPDREWASLAVCSDIGDGVDASEIAPAEFGAPPTTNPDDIAAFLKKPGRRVVFGTYASSDRIAKAQKKAGVPSFDLAVADEAHRIAGVVSAKDKSERSQRVMLEEKEIKAVRRLFATATPRITGSKKTREGDDILIESMDDESRFGKVAHSVTFQEAVKLKRLVPYKLVVTIVTKDEVDDLIKNRRFIDVNGKAYAADEVATAIAIRRAYKDLGISKIISYHSRVAGARAFADLITQVPGRGKPPVTEHVAGSMPVNDRRQVLNRLAAATEPYLVTNARCLTEGIDVPALDAVAFADPRRSQVDIVQAVGRAMRRPMGKSKKTTGYIILPVYLTKKELKDPETAVEGSAFEPVLQVLRALKDHDPFMAQFNPKVLIGKGKRPVEKSSGIDEILEVSISSGIDKQLMRRIIDSVKLQAIRVAVGRWTRGYLALAAWSSEYGHSRPLPGAILNGIDLKSWVSTQRTARSSGALSAERQQLLEKLPGWSWDALEDDFQRYFAMLKEFVNQHATSRVPATFQLKSYPNFGKWVAGQRASYRADRLPSERARLFEELPGWTWDPYSDDYTKGLSALRQYLAGHRFEEITKSTVVNGIRLGSWCASRRKDFELDKLKPERVAELSAIAGWSWEWSAFSFRWATGLSEFRRYFGATGDGLVPVAYRSDSGFKLGSWCNVQRTRRANGTMPPAQYSILDVEPGWVWSARSVKEATYFEGGLNGYRELVAKGLTPTARDADPEVKRWFAAILARYRRGKLKPEELQAIESIPGHVWERSETVATRASTATSEQIKQVASFAKAIGTADFDKNRVAGDGYPVGLALQRLRQKHRAGKLSRAEVEELNKLPKWQWAKAVPRLTSRASFEDRLSQAIRVANGKSLRAIPVKFRDKDGFRAGKWVSEQIVQYNRKTLPKERARQLEQTFGWYWGDKVEEARSK
jgi:superfamily II DNA or RNA helicase